MKKFLSISLFIAICAMTVNAERITPNTAEQIASQFLQNNIKLRGTSNAPLQLVHTAKSAAGEADYYVFNRGSDAGYIFVSGDDRALPVLGYGESGSFDVNSIPDNMRWWLSQYQDEMQWLRNHPEATPRRVESLRASVAPLLSTKWNQGSPYCWYCPPAEYEGTYYYTYTGCVATATAQIMKYYNWPPAGRGYHQYDCYVNNAVEPTMLSADFSQSNYQWEQMLDEYYYGYYSNEQGLAVAKLMSDVGIAVNMKYGLSGSGTSSQNVLPALRAYFDYDAGMQLYTRSDYSGDWDAMLRAELNEHRPIYYSGSNSNAGHAFVFDGYDSSGYFHINWGWGGVSDNYFSTSSLNPSDQGAGSSEGGYSNGQTCIIGIQPSQSEQASLALVIDVTPVADTMPANDIRARATFGSYGGDYQGGVGLWVIDEDYNVYDYVWAELDITQGNTKTVTFYSSIDGANDGETYYFAIHNPYYPNIGYIWGGVIPFTIGDWSSLPLENGDVTGDNSVDIDDVNAVINIILKVKNEDEYPGNADLTNDGEIDVDDMNAIINIILSH